MSNRPLVFVHFLPLLIPSGSLKGGIAVVVDVLRASTVIVHALEAGCEGVIPCLEVEEARRLAASLPVGSALLGGERGGAPIAGFDLGSSPSSYTPENCRGKSLVITTTNGTRAILASLDADRVLVAAFVNRRATVETLAEEVRAGDGRPIHLVCSGTQGYISLEDAHFAGALTVNLESEVNVTPGNDEARIAAALWKNTVESQSGAQNESIAIQNTITLGRGGQNVRRLGLENDIKDAAQVDRFDLVAELHRNPLRIVASRKASP
jgi:2-phosphosulfolactate phosphatase